MTGEHRCTPNWHEIVSSLGVFGLVNAAGLVLFTDGVTEAENEGGEDLGGLQHVAHRLATMHGAGADELTRAIESEVLSHMGDTPLADDVTLVVVSRNL